MSAYCINEGYKCGECRHANEYGQGCDFGVMFQLLLLMSGERQCPNFEYKDKEQMAWRDECLAKMRGGER